MPQEKKELKVLDCRASDHEYLHRDFHGALCYAIKYLDDNYGPEATASYLQQVGRSYYSPLIAQLKSDGLAALEKHLRHIFTTEAGKFDIEYQNGTLVLTVTECPAVAHLKKIKQLCTNRFCETTVVVNETICAEAGFRCSCAYEPGQGRCVQKFWKAEQQPPDRG